MMITRIVAALVAACCLFAQQSAAQAAPPAGQTLHVDVAKGADTNAGLSRDAAFKSIQKACDVVNPGDTVIVYPGVYFENVKLKRAGTAEKPITFQADHVGRGRVVVTLADKALRIAEKSWTLEDESLQLYSVALDHWPCRVMYDDVDLLPYPTLDGLKKFMLNDANPGALHGFAYDPSAKKLYARLHAESSTRPFKPAGAYGQPRYPSITGTGKYGSLNPNDHVMAAAPRRAEGNKGSYIDRDDCFNWGILTEGPAHVVLDGFTFETPAVTGVYVRGSDVVVRNAWFVGCKAGVTGGPKTDNDIWSGSDNVVVEQCEYSQFPACSDAEEVIALYADDPKIAKTRFFWWQRKGQSDGSNIDPKYDYEVGGITMEMGKNWVIRHNYVHEAFDGFSAGQKGSEGLLVYNNRFERIVDNSVQTENHGANWRVYGNEIVDNYMPISWQPLAGTPWPGPIYLYKNLIYNTPDFDAMWRRAGYPGAWLKAGVRDSNWKWPKHMKDVPKGVAAAPGDGFVVFNNTIVLSDSLFLERTSGHPLRMENFHFYNNIFVTRPIADGVSIAPDTGAEWDFAHNLSSPPGRTKSVAGQVLAGKNGLAVVDASRIGFVDPKNYRFELQAGSPAIGAGMSVPSQSESFKDLGAIPYGQTWQSPAVGPRQRRE